jgi:O-antigen/teichoic acid export membrane protein
MTKKLTRRLALVSSRSAATTIASALLAALAHVVIARVAGVAEYGFYAAATAWIALVSFCATRGRDTAILKFFPQYRSTGATQRLNSLAACAHKQTVWASVALSATVSLALGALYLGGVVSSRVLTVSIPALLSIPFLSTTTIWASILVSYGRVGAAQGIPNLLRPLIVLTGVLCMDRVGFSISATHILTCALIAAVLANAVIRTMALRTFGAGRRVQANSGDHAEELAGFGRMAFFISILTLVLSQAEVQIGSLLLAPIELGVLAAAARLSLFVPFPVTALNTAFAPAVSGLHATGDRNSLSKLVGTFALLNLISSTSVCAALVVFGRQLLGLFGSDFESGYMLLVVLSLGRLAMAMAGLGGQLLNMTGHQQAALIGVAAAVTVQIGTMAILVFPFGATGIAIGTALGCLVWAVVITRACQERLQLNPLWNSGQKRS